MKEHIGLIGYLPFLIPLALFAAIKVRKRFFRNKSQQKKPCGYLENYYREKQPRRHY